MVLAQSNDLSLIHIQMCIRDREGTHLYFDVVSVGATINVMMAAAMADGITILENVAKEPHVVLSLIHIQMCIRDRIIGAVLDIKYADGHLPEINEAIEITRQDNTRPVSYTHLDVYKRQYVFCMLTMVFVSDKIPD